MRQTDLSFEELHALLENPTRDAKFGLLANEIGELAIGGTIEGEAARIYLIEMLANANPWIRYPAYGYGTRVPNPSEDLKRALIVFEQDPDNNHIVELVRERNGQPL